MLLLILSMNTFLFASSLIPCPDCEKEVSRRALMCPNCGLKGEIIIEHAKTIPEPVIGDVLMLECEGRTSFALPVKFDGRSFAVFPLERILGAKHFKLSCGDREVRWAVPELAVDAPIVRVHLSDTNLISWVVGGELVFDGSRIKAKGNELYAVTSPLVSTNNFALEGRSWDVLQPKQMKNHGRSVL